MTIQYNTNQIGNIPKLSGIYYFYEITNLLYIGKAKNLRYRIADHYGDIYSHQKINMVMNRVTRIDIEVNLNYNQLHQIETGLIHELKPLFNYQTCVADKEIDDKVRKELRFERSIAKEYWDDL